MNENIYIEYELIPNIYNIWEYLNLPSNWVHSPFFDVNNFIPNSRFSIHSFSGPKYNKYEAYSCLLEFFEKLKTNEIVKFFKIIENIELQ